MGAHPELVRAYPAFLRRVVGHMTFSRRHLPRLQKRAAESHQRRYPGDYVYTHVEGDGVTFDFGVDCFECVCVKLLKEQGAPELAPSLYPVDILYSELPGWGLVRTMTLSEGAVKCDFRLTRGGETRVAVAEPLEKYIRSRRT